MRGGGGGGGGGSPLRFRLDSLRSCGLWRTDSFVPHSQMGLIAAYLYAGVIMVVTVSR